MVPARAPSRTAFLSVTLAPKSSPNCTIPTISSRTGRSTNANSTIACPIGARVRRRSTRRPAQGRAGRARRGERGARGDIGTGRVGSGSWESYRPLGYPDVGTDGRSLIIEPPPHRTEDEPPHMPDLKVHAPYEPTGDQPQA